MEAALTIRADASAQIGAGHVMRCLALAQAWQDCGGGAQFVSASMPERIESRLLAEGILVHRIGAPPGTAADANATTLAAERAGSRWIAADSYAFPAEYQQALRQAGMRLLTIDDLGRSGPYSADLVLSQNAGASESLYAERQPHTRLLLGPRYALLRREFHLAPVARRAGGSRRILITMGGSDPGNVTVKALRALEHVRPERTEVVVAAGPANPRAAELAAAASGLPFPCRIEPDANMPELVVWADVALSAAGSTCWELALLGVPSILVQIAENQRGVAENLERAGAADNLGWHADVTPEAIARALERLLGSPALREERSRALRGLVDGCGAARVAGAMGVSRPVVLRRVREADCRVLWEWANDPEIRSASFSPAPIPWEVHTGWLARKLSDPDCFFYMALDTSGNAIGQVRYDRAGADAVVSVAVAPKERGKGYGSRLIALSARQLFRETGISLIRAFVKEGNAASIRTFEKSGFTSAGAAGCTGHAALLFTLSRGMHP